MSTNERDFQVETLFPVLHVQYLPTVLNFGIWKERAENQENHNYLGSATQPNPAQKQ